MVKQLFLTSSVHEAPREHSFNGIDLVKFVCTYLICMIHIAPFQTSFLGLDRFDFYVQSYLCRIAVPFYFVTSGFLLFRKMEPYAFDQDRIKRFTLKMIRLLGIWFMLLIVGQTIHLWYFRSVIAAIILAAFLLNKTKKFGLAAVIAFFTYTIGLFFDSYRYLIEPFLNYPLAKLIIIGFENVFLGARNGIFFGLIFVLMGALFAQKRIVLPRIAVVLGLIASYALLFWEVHFLRKHSSADSYNLLIFLIPAVFFTFYLASHLNLTNRPIYPKLRAVGVMVFFMHLLVKHYTYLLLRVFKGITGIDLSPLHFIATAVVSTALAFGILKLSENPKLQWLKYLYS